MHRDQDIAPLKLGSLPSYLINLIVPFCQTYVEFRSLVRGINRVHEFGMESRE